MANPRRKGFNDLIRLLSGTSSPIYCFFSRFPLKYLLIVPAIQIKCFTITIKRVVHCADEEEEREPTYGAGEGESDEELSPPTPGNTEGKSLQMSKKQLKEGRGKETHVQNIQSRFKGMHFLKK